MIKDFVKNPIKKQIRKTGLVKELEIEKQNLKAQNGNLMNQINHYKLENCKLKKDIVNLVSEKEKFKGEFVDAIKFEFEPLEKENLYLKKQLKNTEKKNKNLKQQLKNTKNENENLKQQIKTIQTKMKIILSERSELTKLINAQFESLKTEKKELN